MADEYGYDEDEQQQEKASTLRQKLQDAERRAKEAEALASENQNLKHRLAVSDAGLTLTDLQRTALLATHTGDLTPEGLKSTAQALGFIQAPPPVPDDPSLAVHAQIAAAAAGTQAPVADRDAEIDAGLAAAKTEAEFMALYAQSGRPING